MPCSNSQFIFHFTNLHIHVKIWIFFIKKHVFIQKKVCLSLLSHLLKLISQDPTVKGQKISLVGWLNSFSQPCGQKNKITHYQALLTIPDTCKSTQSDLKMTTILQESALKPNTRRRSSQLGIGPLEVGAVRLFFWVCCLTFKSS